MTDDKPLDMDNTMIAIVVIILVLGISVIGSVLNHLFG
jgi:hypothetical protein